MKALITAGGRGTRLRPITNTINKHLIPLAGKPMIFHAIEKIIGSGIKEIFINTNEGEQELQKVIGNGSRFGSDVIITFFEQKGGPLGIANVVSQAERFIKKSPFVLYLGDNIILDSITEFITEFTHKKCNCMLALSRVKDPSQFGVAILENGKLIKIIEKPTNPPSPFAVTGIYIYDSSIFEAVKTLKPSSRNEYEISEAHTWLIDNGFNVGYKEITGWWKDTGRSEDLLMANRLLLEKIEEEILGEVEDTVTIVGPVVIGKDASVQGRSIIRGPAVVGEGSVIKDSYVGPFTSVGNRVELYGAEVEHSVIFDDADIHVSERIVDSLIGANSTIIPSHNSIPSGHKLLIGSNSMVEL